MSDSGPPEKEKPAGRPSPNRQKTETNSSSDVNSSLETIVSQLSAAEDILADLALDDPKQFGELLWTCARVRLSRRDILSVLQRSHSE